MDESEIEKMRKSLEEWNAKYCREGESIRREGPTPNGGDYSVAYYYDSKIVPVKKKMLLGSLLLNTKKMARL